MRDRGRESESVLSTEDPTHTTIFIGGLPQVRGCREGERERERERGGERE